jgi:hypothetical protein
MAVEAEVTHPRTLEVEVADDHPAAAAAMPRLRVAVAATAVAAVEATTVAVTKATKNLVHAGKRYAARKGGVFCCSVNSKASLVSVP